MEKSIFFKVGIAKRLIAEFVNMQQTGFSTVSFSCLCLQLQQEAFAEYEKKMKTISAEVQDLVKNCMKVCYPLEADTAKREAPGAADEGDQGPCGNLVTPETLSYATEVVKEDAIMDEESTEVQESRL